MIKKSQRREGFNGGIKTGTSATSKESKQVDGDVRKAAKLAFEILKPRHPKLSISFKVPALFDNSPGCNPDGGMWYYGKKTIATIEAKYQGEGGNAIERWFKNYNITKYLNPKATYLTFCSGKGSVTKNDTLKKSGPIVRNMNLAFGLNKQKPMYNQINPLGISAYLSRDGFEMDYLVSTIVECLDKTIREQ